MRDVDLSWLVEFSMKDELEKIAKKEESKKPASPDAVPKANPGKTTS